MVDILGLANPAKPQAAELCSREVAVFYAGHGGGVERLHPEPLQDREGPSVGRVRPGGHTLQAEGVEGVTEDTPGRLRGQPLPPARRLQPVEELDQALLTHQLEGDEAGEGIPRVKRRLLFPLGAD